MLVGTGPVFRDAGDLSVAPTLLMLAVDWSPRQQTMALQT
jgi:hypothetical protein